MSGSAYGVGLWMGRKISTWGTGPPSGFMRPDVLLEGKYLKKIGCGSKRGVPRSGKDTAPAKNAAPDVEENGA